MMSSILDNINFGEIVENLNKHKDNKKEICYIYPINDHFELFFHTNRIDLCIKYTVNVDDEDGGHDEIEDELLSSVDYISEDCLKDNSPIHVNSIENAVAELIVKAFMKN